jgi:hypothetical protein
MRRMATLVLCPQAGAGALEFAFDDGRTLYVPEYPATARRTRGVVWDRLANLRGRGHRVRSAPGAPAPTASETRRISKESRMVFACFGRFKGGDQHAALRQPASGPMNGLCDTLFDAGELRAGRVGFHPDARAIATSHAAAAETCMQAAAEGTSPAVVLHDIVSRVKRAVRSPGKSVAPWLRRG